MTVKCPRCSTVNHIPEDTAPNRRYRCRKCGQHLPPPFKSDSSSDKRRRAEPATKVVTGEQRVAVVVGVVVLCFALTILSYMGISDMDRMLTVREQENLNIILAPNMTLTQSASPVAEITQEERQLAELITNTLEIEDGHGLSAPQVGALKRISVVELRRSASQGQIIVMVNPEIIDQEGTVPGREGCLSIPGTKDDPMEIERSERITVRYVTLEGAEVVLQEEGWNARIIQHEIDHLDGVLITDLANTFDINPKALVAIAIFVVAALLKMYTIATRIVQPKASSRE